MKGTWAALEGVYGHEALCLSVTKKYPKRFTNGRIRPEDNSRSGRASQSNLSESVHALIEESPFILCKRIRQKLWIAKTA
jgi:hypothetical protein